MNNKHTRAKLRVELQALVEQAAFISGEITGGHADAVLSIQQRGSGVGFTVMACDSWERALGIAGKTVIAIHAGKSSGAGFNDRADIALNEEEFKRSVEALTK